MAILILSSIHVSYRLHTNKDNIHVDDQTINAPSQDQIMQAFNKRVIPKVSYITLTTKYQLNSYNYPSNPYL